MSDKDLKFSVCDDMNVSRDSKCDYDNHGRDDGDDFCYGCKKYVHSPP